MPHPEDHPHHHGPHGPHHDGHHGPHQHEPHDPHNRSRPPQPHIPHRSKYPDHVVGVLGWLLDRADEYSDIDDLRDNLDRRAPGEVKYLAPAIAELEAGGKEVTAKRALRVMADNKAIEFYQRDKTRVLHGLNGNGTPNIDGAPLHALIVPIPKDYSGLLEGISVGKIYVLPDHPVPHWLDKWDVAPLPVRFRTIKEELNGALSISFEAYCDRGGRMLTRNAIIELLSDLAEAGCKPLLRIIEMPQFPHHEKKPVAIPDGYEIEPA